MWIHYLTFARINVLALMSIWDLTLLKERTAKAQPLWLLESASVWRTVLISAILQWNLTLAISSDIEKEENRDHKSKIHPDSIIIQLFSIYLDYLITDTFFNT